MPVLELHDGQIAIEIVDEYGVVPERSKGHVGVGRHIDRMHEGWVDHLRRVHGETDEVVVVYGSAAREVPVHEQ